MNTVSGRLRDFVAAAGLEIPGSQLEIYIGQACDPMLYKTPDLNLNLEICDTINSSKKTAPRDAAFQIVKYMNLSSAHANLAIPLLDTCAKNCGYPFHIVISSKEFLNELVRRFPEVANNVTQTQRRILDLLAEWNLVYAKRSRYRDDFKHITEMCNLLEYKGYRIPILNDKDVPNLDPEFNLKTEEQLEEEDRKNQGTKLEELIRKGTPAALAEANDMMKIMSGYDKSKKPDYKVQVSSELERIESKAILLNDLLNNMSAADMRNQRDSTLSDLHLSTTLAQQKLQKFIEENDDEDRMSQLLELNDLIITVLKKYENISQGASVEKNSLDRVVVDIEKTNAKRGASIPNLIDFDVVEDAPVSNPISFDLFSSVQQHQNNLFNTSAAIQLHFPTAIGGDGFKSTPSNPLISGLGIQTKGSNSVMSSPSNFAMQNAVGQMPTNSKSNSSNDPFANIDIFSSNAGELKPAVGVVPPLAKQSKIVECIIFEKNGLQIKFRYTEPTTLATNEITAIFMNVTPVQLNDLTFQVSLPKTMTMQLSPPSTTILLPFNQAPATQQLQILNPSKEVVRIRFKVGYNINGAQVFEMGEFFATS